MSGPSPDTVHCPLRIGGMAVSSDSRFDVRDRFSGTLVGTVSEAGRAEVDAAVDAAKDAFHRRPLPPYERYEILRMAADRIEDKLESIVGTIVDETGFTVADATNEVKRCVQTLLASAEEAKRITGELIPIDGAPGQTNRMGYTMRVPVGVVGAITPFNSPLNTVTHKVAPAIAAGNAVVLKPASYTPLTAAALYEALVESGLPAGFLNIVYGPGDRVGAWLLANPAVSFFTFTGSTAVGETIHAAAGLRRTSLELGSISSTIVCDDADLDGAASRCVSAAFRKAGQVCTSVQRLYVHRDALDALESKLAEAIATLPVGDPHDPETVVGPMIDAREAERAAAWIDDAVTGGAAVVTGGPRRGALLPPTLLTGVRSDMRVMCDEIFAPVMCLVPFQSFDEALDGVNDTPYGLAAGVFTNNLERALEAARRLHVGGVHINETSSSRVDLMPYGGAKASGFGKEGPRYAIREMTEERLVTIRWSDRR